ncbi:DUF3592 domain-containing protein [Amycolatopsis sp. NPDC059657]|uniref:DUF3592 domain-containing protein n=1 Tax=Amycolatopsis sp. NPDC059657 TaxID=3346899 RepID=UPI003671992E
MLSLAVFIGGILGFVLLAGAADNLLTTGSRTTGVVESVHSPTKGARSIQVQYTVEGRSYHAEIETIGRTYRLSDNVTVVYDPADPELVRTAEDPNSNHFLMMVCVVTILVSLLFLMASLIAARQPQPSPKFLGETEA